MVQEIFFKWTNFQKLKGFDVDFAVETLCSKFNKDTADCRAELSNSNLDIETRGVNCP